MNPVDQVFMDEIKRESYIRSLTDDFSVVDIAAADSIHEVDAITIAAVGAGVATGLSLNYAKSKALKVLKQIVSSHGMDASKVRHTMANMHSNVASNFTKIIWCYRITDDATGRKKRSTIQSIINDFKTTEIYDDLHLSEPEIAPKGTRYEDDAGVIGFRKSLL